MGIFHFESSEVITFLIQIGFALIAVLVIGLEREYKGKQAGLKTNALAAISSAVFVIISLQYQDQDGVDVTRVLSQVGVGFLGAGVILQKGGKIEGLTTAATLWCSTGAGCLAAKDAIHILTKLLALRIELADRWAEKTGEDYITIIRNIKPFE